MNTKILSATVLAALLAASGAVIATAQTVPADDAVTAPAMEAPAAPADAPAGPTAHGFFSLGGRGHDEGWGHGGPGGSVLRGVLAQADADGTVTQEEIDALRATLVQGADTSGEGDLSLDEFQAVYIQLVRPQVVDAFQDLDEDGDAVVTPAELDARLGGVVADLDRDGDGALSQADGGRGGDRDGRGDRD